MEHSGVLYDSLPITRLGVRTDDEVVVLAPDFSTFAYMLEEYITLATAKIVIPSSIPESKNLTDLPALLKTRVRVIDDSAEREAVSRLLYPLRSELGVKQKAPDARLNFSKAMNSEWRHRINFVHRDLLRLATGFNHNLQVGIYPEGSRHILSNLRKGVSDINARAILAQIEGILGIYGEVSFQSPRPETTSAPELLSLFDRLLNDPDYLQLSDAVSDLALPKKREAALSRIRECGRKLVTNGVVTKGWNFVGKVVKAWTGVPVPEAETLLPLFSGKDFPMFIDLRQARKWAINRWIRSAKTSQPVSASGDTYEGLSWILPAQPPSDWDGGDISTMTFGTVNDLLKNLERFAQQSPGAYSRKVGIGLSENVQE
ncbi:MAG: hypothetical protein NPIRA05_03550 [Nitrospirales bacterium]|nr:MAG: hypothetical protein NPIRA05_03550 [Nitrospirales bacterium]